MRCWAHALRCRWHTARSLTLIHLAANGIGWESADEVALAYLAEIVVVFMAMAKLRRRRSRRLILLACLASHRSASPRSAGVGISGS